MNDQQFQKVIRKFFQSKKYDELIKIIEKEFKIQHRPGGLSSLVGVCRMLKSNYTKNDVILALSDFEDAFSKLKKSPGGIEALGNYATACIRNSQKYVEIIKYLNKAKDLFDDLEKEIGYDEKLYLIGIDIYKYLVDIKKVIQLSEKLLINNSKSKVNACIYGMMHNYSYDWNSQDYLNYSKKFKTLFPKLKVNDINKIKYFDNKKIKLGFVSCDFKLNHSVTYFVKNTLKYLSREKFEIFIYQIGDTSVQNESSLELKNNSDHWYDLTTNSNQEIIDVIQKDKIEILFDVMGLTAANRIEIFNNRVSPLQISWLAFCNTVGFEDIDFLIADNNLIYDNEAKYYSEKILKLQNIWNCHSGFSLKRELPKLPFDKNKFITFGSFNNFLKISDETVYTWSLILKKIKNSKLILKSSLSYQTNNIVSKFRKYGVEKQLQFFDKQNFSNTKDHLKLYDSIDICLDTFPYNGVTTTFEALWCGLPVVVMKGFNFNSRCGESIIKNGNLDYFLANNQDEYVEKAIMLSQNIDRLKFEREKIFNNVLDTPLFDSKIFAKDLENKLLQIYNRKL